MTIYQMTAPDIDIRYFIRNIANQQHQQRNEEQTETQLACSASILFKLNFATKKFFATMTKVG